VALAAAAAAAGRANAEPGHDPRIEIVAGDERKRRKKRRRKERAVRKNHRDRDDRPIGPVELRSFPRGTRAFPRLGAFIFAAVTLFSSPGNYGVQLDSVISRDPIHLCNCGMMSKSENSDGSIVIRIERDDYDARDVKIDSGNLI